MTAQKRAVESLHEIRQQQNSFQGNRSSSGNFARYIVKICYFCSVLIFANCENKHPVTNLAYTHVHAHVQCMYHWL